MSQHPPFFFLFSALKHTHCSKRWCHMFRTTLLLHTPILVGKWMLRQTVGAAQPGPSRILFVNAPLDCNAFEFHHITSQLLPLVLLANLFPRCHVSRVSRRSGSTTARMNTSSNARWQNAFCKSSLAIQLKNARSSILSE